MIVLFLGLIAGAVAGLFGLHRLDDNPRSATPGVVSLGRVLTALLLLVVAFGAHLTLLVHAAHVQHPVPVWFDTLPIRVLNDLQPSVERIALAPAIVTCALAETLACGALFFLLRGHRLGAAAGAAIVCTAAGMLIAALAIPVATSFDMYAYIGSAHVPDPYHPPATAFSGELSVLNRYYGVPILASPYGPAWLLLVHCLLAPFRTLGAQLLALRSLGACGLIAAVLALRALGASAAEVGIAALNPALILYFVLDGHNDIVGVALVLWAIVLSSRLPLVAALLAIVAGGMKVPFIVVGALTFARSARAANRILGAACVAVGALALSLAGGGAGYLNAIRQTTRVYHVRLEVPLTNDLHAVLAAFALLAVAAAVTVRRYSPGAAWSFVAFGAVLFGWYVAWGIPYAALERRWLGVFLASLPLLWFLLSNAFWGSGLLIGAIKLAAYLGPLAIYLAVRRQARRRLAPST